jgi:hypothetical protein
MAYEPLSNSYIMATEKGKGPSRLVGSINCLHYSFHLSFFSPLQPQPKLNGDACAFSPRTTVQSSLFEDTDLASWLLFLTGCPFVTTLGLGATDFTVTRSLGRKKVTHSLVLVRAVIPVARFCGSGSVSPVSCFLWGQPLRT